MTIETIENYANLNPEERKAYQSAIKEIVDSMTRIESEQELIKEICNQQKEKYKIKPATTKKAAKIVYQRSLEEDRADAEEFFAWVEVTLKDVLK